MSNPPTPSCGLCQIADAAAASDPLNASSSSFGSFFSRIFDADGFMPRWRCGDWDAWLGWMHIGADTAIFLAYTAIPITLLYFIRRRRDVPLRGIFWLFALFILSCGCTHVLDATMFYRPMYRLLGLFKVITALVSIATVVALVRVFPSALRLPGIIQSQESQLAERARAEAEIRALSDKLQDRNSLLTVENRRIASAMEIDRVGAVCWRARSGKIEWEVGVRTALRHDSRILELASWAEIFGTADLAVLLAESQAAVRAGRPAVIVLPLIVGAGQTPMAKITGVAEKGTDPDDPALIGFVRCYDKAHGPPSPSPPSGRAAPT